MWTSLAARVSRAAWRACKGGENPGEKGGESGGERGVLEGGLHARRPRTHLRHARLARPRLREERRRL